MAITGNGHIEPPRIRNLTTRMWHHGKGKSHLAIVRHDWRDEDDGEIDVARVGAKPSKEGRVNAVCK